MAETSSPPMGAPRLLHSFDVGIRNLARAVLDLDTGKLVEWDLLDCSRGFEGNLNQTRIEEIVRMCGIAWAELAERLMTYPAETVLIELQPRFNQKMMILQYCFFNFLAGAFFRRGCFPTFRFVPPSLKLRPELLGLDESPEDRGTELASQYRANKRYTKDHCAEVLLRRGDIQRADWFESQGGKRDDLADCYLQAVAWLASSSSSMRRAPTKPRVSRTVRAKRLYARAVASDVHLMQQQAPPPPAATSSAAAISSAAAAATSTAAAPRRATKRSREAATAAAARARFRALVSDSEDSSGAEDAVALHRSTAGAASASESMLDE